MRLSIRWKLLVLLLTLAVVPLAIVAVAQQRGTRRLGTELADRTGHIVAEAAQDHLASIVDHAAKAMTRKRQAIELALVMQALEVSAHLAHRPVEGLPVYFDHAFGDPATAPPGMGPSDRHVVVHADDGGRQPLQVSYRHQAVRLSPGVDAAEVADDVKRVAGLTQVYRPLYERLGDLIYWQYTALESGVHTSYPGKGDYPADFEPRQRPWYVRTREAGGVTLVGPFRDATTGNMMVTFAAPVRRADGSFAGVTAIDVSLGEILRMVTLPTDWGRDARAMFVRADAMLSPDAPIVLVTPQDDEVATWDWRRDAEVRPLEADDPEQTRPIVEDMLAGKANERVITRGGEAWLCAYGPVSELGASLMVSLPRSRVVAGASQVEQQMLARTWEQLRLTGWLAGGVLVLTVVAGLLASRHFTWPVKQLAAAADRIATGDLDTQVHIRTADELEQMGRAFNAMVPKLRDRLRMRQSLSVAMQVQQSLLPAKPPTLPGLDIAGQSIYCDETGGDYYDFLTVEPVSSHAVAIAVGDVTGHGIAAALLMATGRALIRSHLDDPHPLADTFTRVNRHLTIDRLPGRFMTLYCLVIDTQTRTLRWTSAGHDPAIVYQPHDGTFSQWAGEDVPMGIDGNWTYHESAHEGWTAGDVAVIGTDGIWECRSPAGEQFGKDRLRDVIREHADDTAHAISDAIVAAVHAHRGDGPQEDDITLVVVKFT